jgi:hypothetical protein
MNQLVTPADLRTPGIAMVAVMRLRSENRLRFSQLVSPVSKHVRGMQLP